MDLTAFPTMDDQHLCQYAKNTARALRPEGEMGGRAVSARTLECLKRLGACRDRAGESTSPAAEWLLDNWYLAQREGAEAAQSFRRARGLRAVRREGRRPVVTELARAFVQAAGEDAAPPRLALFLTSAQGELPLTEGELSLLVPALKCALVERLTALAEALDTPAAPPDLAQGLGSAFTALRTLAGADFGPLLEEASQVETLLRRDPAGLYTQMDEDTRRRYRQQVCRLAKRRGVTQFELARQAADWAAQETGERRHVGFFLFPRRENPWAGPLYVGGVVVTTLALALLAGFWVENLWVTLLLLLPASDVAKNCADFLVVRLLPPRAVHRLALEGGLPPEGRTLCVVATLLTGPESGGRLCALLEQYRLSNRDAGAELRLGILADLPDSDHPMGAREAAWVEAARSAVDDLNARHGGGFYLLFRTPVFHAPDERYMGWERKRGALVELVRLLRGKSSGLQALSGDPTWLEGVRYVITLDGDTSLNVGAAREFVGAMLHPLNRPRLDEKRRVVTAGYGLLQPRVAVDLESANRSQFSRIFAGQGGLDPYGSASSDVYHDLFDQGTYTGKGIFDVAVFDTCLDRRLPDNAVLSHDLLEGSYLRAGLCGDVELADGYPYKVTAYFSRLHRWVRGDWQVLPWILPSVRVQSGAREKNPLPSLAKWKIFDNLRRSISPVSTLLALVLGMCLSGPAFALAAGAAVLSAASNLLLSGADLAFRGGKGLRDRYHATIITGFGGLVLQTVVQLLLLPYQAWVCLTAALTALWRMGVSHRGLLAWTTAAEAERKAGDSPMDYFAAMWPVVAVGFVCMFFAKFPAGAAAGLVWVLSPLFAWALSRPVSAQRAVPAEERPFLLHQAALIWRFFEDFLRPEDHWLPPDNWQEQPLGVLARRTSPTNIGMGLLCCLAAADLDLTGRARAAALIAHTLDTLEGLPKWQSGHFYNWYDTATAQPLEPKYVSTVDSGNLCGSLIALVRGLEEWGEHALARRAQALADEMDFSVLYDRSRRLFTIGWDCSKEAFTQGWYDLMASEARQTSYLAVARGEVPPRHWRRLSRMLVGQDHYSGMASWTGTMFEYFMPHLLLPAYENSLLCESLAFCVYAQKKRTAGTAPWGISESGFFAFDPAMNYQYKAHGVQRLGLKRGLDRELVVAPYATFLALLTAPRSACRNLRRLRDLGLEGPYGLYEAADFTPARRTGKRPFEPVRSYMAHHMGMSLVSIDNALHHNVMQRRFMADPAMSAYRELLQEKVPVGPQIMRAPRREVPEKPRRAPGQSLRRTGEGYADPPACHLLSGGAWSALCTDTGCVRSTLGKLSVSRCHPAEAFQPAGLSFFLKTDLGLLPLTPAPLYRKGVQYGWRFQGDRAVWTARDERLKTTLTLRLPEEETGEVWEAAVHWTGPEELRGELVCYLEPVLAKREDYAAHPAFSKLSLESRALEDGVLFTRRPRRRLDSRPALAVLWEGQATLDTARETALGRGGLRALALALDRPAQGSVGAVLDPCLLARFPLTLAPGKLTCVRLALSAADGGEVAASAARRLLRLPAEGAGSRLDRLIRQDGLTGQEALHAFELLRHLEFPDPGAYRPGGPEQPDLWPHGISGDLPLAVFRVADGEGAEKALRLVGEHQLLAQCGYTFDLALLLNEGGDYHRPLRTALIEGLKTTQRLHKLGAPGGVHLVEGETLPATTHLPLGELVPRKMDRENHFTLHPGMPPWRFTPQGAFVFETGERLPPVGWSMMLCNPLFGWFTDETGNGHLWQGNARENRLTPWPNDPLATGGPQVPRFSAPHLGEGTVSFFAAPDGHPCTVTYAPGFARWEKRVGEQALTCTAFVPPERSTRILILEAPAGEVCYEGARWPVDGVLWLATTSQGTSPMEGEPALLEETKAHWAALSGAITFTTPDRDLDRYLNGWAQYQVVACRLFGRTSMYQCGGAYGFRDQLQDVCALLLTTPALARDQILRACAHQYPEGDVQHWWHPDPKGGPERGVRTKISDDLLFLPYVLCEYLERTGDESLLAQQVSLLEGAPLGELEHQRYGQNTVSNETLSVFEHAKRAVDCALGRGFGPHGLALMGTGDWNDGMDLVGAGGRGESVWLTWFFSLVLERFSALCDKETGENYREMAKTCAQKAEEAWDGDWFLRGWYDDGTTLGSHRDAECRIDSVAQSFAALCPYGDKEKATHAVRSALDHLFDRAHSVVKLYTPPFDQSERDPGYIRGYLPGVRENGGQYTHAAVWLALACFRLGHRESGMEVLRALLPTSHEAERYKGEPYVLAADVYANPQHMGRAGWTWYTGAAGWFYRVATEELLGLQVRRGRLFLEPSLPGDWAGYTGQWRTERGLFTLEVCRGAVKGLLLDGLPCPEGVPVWTMEGKHNIKFTI